MKKSHKVVVLAVIVATQRHYGRLYIKFYRLKRETLEFRVGVVITLKLLVCSKF